MKRLALLTFAAIVGLQSIFWIVVFLQSTFTPQVTQNTQQTERATGTGNLIAVEMTDSLRRGPTEITIRAGDTVEWRNIGSISWPALPR